MLLKIYQFHGRLSVIFSSMGLNFPDPPEPRLFIIKRWVSGMVCHQALKLQTNWKNFRKSLDAKDLEVIMQSYEKMLHNCLRDCFFLDVTRVNKLFIKTASFFIDRAPQFLQRDRGPLREGI
jgi:hypothetical protein